MAENVAANAAAFSAAAYVESERHISERLVRPASPTWVGPSLLPPKPCRTMIAGRRSPSTSPSGTWTTPVSVRPSDSKGDVVLHQNGPARKAWVSPMSFDISERS